MQPRPRDPVARRQARHERRPVVVGQHGRAVGEEGAVPEHRVPVRDRPLRQPERVQRAQRVAGLDDPDAVDVPRRVLLDDVDLDAVPPQRDRRAQAADAAADDEDAPDLRHSSPKSCVVRKPRRGGLRGGGLDRRPALHHRVGHRQVLPERRPALARAPHRRLPVRLRVDPAAGVDLDPEAAGLADVQVRDLVDAVDARAELDRRVVRHEDLGRALDVEPLVDAVGDVVAARRRAAEVRDEPEVVRGPDPVARHRAEDVEARLRVQLGGVALAQRLVEADVALDVRRRDRDVVDVARGGAALGVALRAELEIALGLLRRRLVALGVPEDLVHVPPERRVVAERTPVADGRVDPPIGKLRSTRCATMSGSSGP